ncbi:MAG: hypothetical protein JJU12_01540 [Chlamydiales bacterium]|nr:hypothetical protein [Chlamydiales bacterium]
MSVSGTAPYDFLREFSNADEAFAVFANKMPKEGMESFTKESDGSFTIVYKEKNSGVASLKDEDGKEQLKDVTVKVSQCVKGKIYPKTETEGGRIVIESGGIVGSKKMTWPLPDLNISLTTIKAVGDKFSVIGSYGIINKQVDLSAEQIMFTQINWKG